MQMVGYSSTSKRHAKTGGSPRRAHTRISFPEITVIRLDHSTQTALVARTRTNSHKMVEHFRKSGQHD